MAISLYDISVSNYLQILGVLLVSWKRVLNSPARVISTWQK